MGCRFLLIPSTVATCNPSLHHPAFLYIAWAVSIPTRYQTVDQSQIRRSRGTFYTCDELSHSVADCSSMVPLCQSARVGKPPVSLVYISHLMTMSLDRKTSSPRLTQQKMMASSHPTRMTNLLPMIGSRQKKKPSCLLMHSSRMFLMQMKRSSPARKRDTQRPDDRSRRHEPRRHDFPRRMLFNMTRTRLSCIHQPKVLQQSTLSLLCGLGNSGSPHLSLHRPAYVKISRSSSTSVQLL